MGDHMYVFFTLNNCYCIIENFQQFSIHHSQMNIFQKSLQISKKMCLLCAIFINVECNKVSSPFFSIKEKYTHKRKMIKKVAKLFFFCFWFHQNLIRRRKGLTHETGRRKVMRLAESERDPSVTSAQGFPLAPAPVFPSLSLAHALIRCTHGPAVRVRTCTRTWIAWDLTTIRFANSGGPAFLSFFLFSRATSDD